MSYARKANLISIPLGLIVCFMGVFSADAQQAASSSFGATAPHSSSPAGSGVAARGTLPGGDSKWGAGKGAFGSSVQPGGIWHDGSTLGAAQGASAGRNASRASASAPNVIAPRGDVAPASLGPKSSSLRTSGTSNTAHLSHSFSGQSGRNTALSHGAVSKSPGMKLAAAGSRGRTNSFGHSTSNGEKRPSAGLANTGTQRTPTHSLGTGSSSHSGFEPGLTKSDVKSLP